MVFVGEVKKFVGKVKNSWARSNNSWARPKLSKRTLPTTFFGFKHQNSWARSKNFVGKAQTLNTYLAHEFFARLGAQTLGFRPEGFGFRVSLGFPG